MHVCQGSNLNWGKDSWIGQITAENPQQAAKINDQNNCTHFPTSFDPTQVLPLARKGTQCVHQDYSSETSLLLSLFPPPPHPPPSPPPPTPLGLVKWWGYNKLCKTGHTVGRILFFLVGRRLPMVYSVNDWVVCFCLFAYWYICPHQILVTKLNAQWYQMYISCPHPLYAVIYRSTSLLSADEKFP